MTTWLCKCGKVANCMAILWEWRDAEELGYKRTEGRFVGYCHRIGCLDCMETLTHDEDCWQLFPLRLTGHSKDTLARQIKVEAKHGDPRGYLAIREITKAVKDVTKNEDTTMQINFNAYDYDPTQSTSVCLPLGDYKVEITGAEPKIVKDNTAAGYLELTLTILEGEARGLTQKHRLNLYNPSEVAKRIAHQELSAIAFAINRPYLQDTNQLIGGRLVATIGPQENDSRYSEVKIVKCMDGTLPTRPQQQPAQAAPAPTGPPPGFGPPAPPPAPPAFQAPAPPAPPAGFAAPQPNGPAALPFAAPTQGQPNWAQGSAPGGNAPPWGKS